MLGLNPRARLPEVLGRKVNMFTKLGGFLLLLLALGASQARADSVYEIVGTLTLSGNSANPGVSETINFSFELDYATLAAASGQPTLVGTPTFNAVGPLGTFVFGSISGTGINGGPESGYVPFFNVSSPSGPSALDAVEIDLNSIFFFNPATPNPQFSSTMWTCLIPACAEFWPGGGLPGPTGPGGLLWPGTATVAVYDVPVPEPATLGFCVLGGLALLLRKKAFRRSVRTAL
jgi:hypothetical protein